ncbi:LysR family transcriptional regulator [Microbispora sp. NPDC088329]|uniref:LysR family transcriptional regulator n=1 Tax=Microbispora sp. NPDC088329 TaxID=3154869 RepID=UPI00343CEF95
MTSSGMQGVQLGWLQTFIAVYHTGSFTKASRQLGITQPAVTQYIRGLESQLGTLLFDRTPTGAVPTTQGEALAHDIEGSISQLNTAVRRHFGQSPSERPLRLGGPADLVAARVMSSIAPLIASGVDVRISLGEASDLLSDLKSGHLDLVISTVKPGGRGLHSVPLTDEEFALVASPGVADGLPTGRLSDDGGRALERIPLISYAQSMPIIRRYWRTVFEAPAPHSPSVVVPDLRAVISAVVAGAGMSVVPTYLCAEEVAARALVLLLEPEIPPINTFYLAVRSGTLTDPRLASLHRFLVERSKTW